jgi:hypothetical protein
VSSMPKRAGTRSPIEMLSSFRPAIISCRQLKSKSADAGRAADHNLK